MLRLSGARGKLALGLTAIVGLLGLSVIWLVRPPEGSSVSRQARTVLSQLPIFRAAELGKFRKRSLIADIEIEKTEVCPGEDVLITVRADQGKLADVRRAEVLIQGRRTTSAIVRFPAPGVREFWVAVSDGKDGMDFRTKTITVRPPTHPACARKGMLLLYGRPIQRESYRFEILRVSRATPDRYRWDFGNGVVRETTGKSIEHSFMARKQEGPSSVFHVRVTALSGEQSVATARYTVIFPNTYYDTVHVGAPQIPTEAAHRLAAVPGRPGSFATGIRLANPGPLPIKLQSATVTAYPCDTAAQTKTLRLAPAQVLGTDELPPGTARQLTLRLTIPGGRACKVDVRLEGDTEPPRAGSPAPIGQGTMARTTSSMSFTTLPRTKKERQARVRAIALEKQRLLSGDETPVPKDRRGKKGTARKRPARSETSRPEAGKVRP